VPILKNERHELFAQELAKGKSASEAYVSAGFKPSRHNASRLRTNETVAARVLELQMAGAKSAEISVASLIEELEAARVKATSLNQLSAAVRATAEKAKISGLLVERQQVEVVNADPYENLNTHQEIFAKVVEDCGVEAARALAVAFKLDFDEAAIMALCNGASGAASAKVGQARLADRESASQALPPAQSTACSSMSRPCRAHAGRRAGAGFYGGGKHAFRLGGKNA
jgi:hypothetical protein